LTVGFAASQFWLSRSGLRLAVMPVTDSYEKTRARVTRAIADALGEIDEAVDGNGPGDEAAYRQASWLTEAFREATITAGQMRAALVVRVQQSGDLSLARLGEKLGISKARADDLVRAAEGRRKERRKP
jgi:hypothetical protein